jgi:hypothetical protein
MGVDAVVNVPSYLPLNALFVDESQSIKYAYPLKNIKLLIRTSQVRQSDTGFDWIL